MVKLKLWFSIVLFVCCLYFTTWTANSQPQPLQAMSAEIAITPPSKQALAKAVLTETGIAKKYDLYLGNSVEALMSPPRNPKFSAWLQGIFAREAGWKYVESKYVTQLGINLTEAELQELLTLAQQPVMQKLLQAEMQAYANTSNTRNQLFFNVWDQYNSGKFPPPPEVLR